MKKKKKKSKKKFNLTNIFLVVFILIFLSLLGIFIYDKLTFLDRLVYDNRTKWDITFTQNTVVSGDYMGILFEEDYDFNSLPNDVLATIITDYYIVNDNYFFQDENLDENGFYRKTVTEYGLKNIAKEIFGPDVKIPDISDVSYGCGRHLMKQGANYIISSYDTESCGIFNEDADMYLSKVIDYEKKDDLVSIKMKVAYVEQELDDEGNVHAKLYNLKDKSEIIDEDYNVECIYSDLGDVCYNKFKDYLITLKKASDNQYYFNNIKKLN